jgi:purine-nucleoside phosphorylase
VTETAVHARRTAIEEAVAAVRERSGLRPDVAILLDTGPGALADAVSAEAVLPFEEIPNFPHSPVDADPGQVVLGQLDGRAVAVMRGRAHRYDGHTLQHVTFPVRVLHALGVRVLFVAGACRALHPLWSAGELMLVDDHINLLGDNPLVGPNLDELGPRFPDMSVAYDAELRARVERVALEQRVVLRRGVYAAVSGPSLETRAEYRMLRGIGADAVGTGMVPDVIVARHMGMRVMGLHVIADVCLADALQPADVDAAARVVRDADPALARLLRGMVAVPDED